MKIFLASPHTFLKFRGGGQLAELAIGGIFDDADISCGQYDIPTIHRSDIIRGGFDQSITKHRPYILESFYYVDEDTERLLPYFGDFLLDSGAFTFIQNSKSHVEWELYIERYADFINRNKVEKFFELDIDSVVGHEKVLKYRDRLEELTSKKCIPVWHRNRGKDEFIRLCKEYDYIALGGIAIHEISRSEYKYFPWFINTAHKYDCKIHGLGFTNLNGIKQYRFDSVDSTAWTAGNRFGFIYKFDGQTMRKYIKPENTRLANSREAALNNYIEWIKFQQWAEENL